jgi:CDP-diacylglycerol--glycerol-3-phosphate 3-phosphatidyltransferase|tara:strand:+ start:5355 stop:5963 length:609 start_codon:yes stop_codon:yes gene_type:complete
VVNLSQVSKAASGYLTEPVVRLLARTSITPNIITWFGLALAVGAAVLITTGHLLVAGLVVLLAGFFDLLDGALARYTNRATRFGAVLDSTLDRLSEGVLLLGVMSLYAKEVETIGILLAGTALLASMSVSYVRARAEAMGIECLVGLFTRAGRVVVLALGLLLSPLFDNALIIALAHIVGLSFFTVGQRLVYAWRQTKTSSF